MTTVQDRFSQKSLFDRLDLPTAEWASIEPHTSLADAPPTVPNLLPAMVKARRGGFDGRGQYLAHTVEDLQHALRQFAEVGCIIERLVPFVAEGAALLARGFDGESRFYPIVQTVQHEGR